MASQTSCQHLFSNEDFKITYIISLRNPSLWNQSLYCSFNQFCRGLVIAFTILLLLKLELISTARIEYRPLPAPVVNWWKRQRLNYPRDFTGERSSCTRIILKPLLFNSHNCMRLLYYTFPIILLLNYPKYFSRVDSIITFQLVSAKKAPPSIHLSHGNIQHTLPIILQNCIEYFTNKSD